MVIRSWGTDKPKWRQNCSIGAFRQSIEPPYLWLLKGLRYLLTLWADYNKQFQNWKTFGKVNLNSWPTYCDQILWHRQAQVKIKLLHNRLRKVFRDTLPLAFESRVLTRKLQLRLSGPNWESEHSEDARISMPKCSMAGGGSGGCSEPPPPPQ